MDGFPKYLRKQIFARDDATCKDCGRNWYDGFMLECHHIVALHDGGANELDNGILLCRTCHAKRHEHEAVNGRGKKSRRSHAYGARKIRERGIWRYGYG